MSKAAAKKPITAPEQPKWIDANLADVKRIMAIHRYRRPDLSISEHAFIEKFILPVGGVQKDQFGNLYKLVGPKQPRILWSAHTDTVHRQPGIQEVSMYGPKGTGYSKKLALSSEEKVSNCLGADDGAGVWMLLELIKAKIPGLYIFHRNEEHGCQGSKYVLKNHSEVLAGIDIAIAFDRRGKKDIITHQCSVRTCSDVFARSLATALKMEHKPDDGGAYTDTEVYKSVIPECTNVAAGYDGAHSDRESLDMEYLINLRNAVISMNLDDLVVARDPAVVERKGYYGGNGHGHRSWSRNDGWENDYFGHNLGGKGTGTAKSHGHYTPPALTQKPTNLLEYIKKYPEEVATLLEEWGFDHKNMDEMVEARKAGLKAHATGGQPELPGVAKSDGEESEKDVADDKKELPTQAAAEQGDQV